MAANLMATNPMGTGEIYTHAERLKCNGTFTPTIGLDADDAIQQLLRLLVKRPGLYIATAPVRMTKLTVTALYDDTNYPPDPRAVHPFALDFEAEFQTLGISEIIHPAKEVTPNG